MPTPSSAVMAPLPTGTAACIAWPRSFRSRAASASEKAPAAASAEYSPSECPATNFTWSLSLKPFSRSSTRITAIDTAISAGCAFSVSVRVSLGPSHMICERFWPSAASTSSNTSRAARRPAASSRPMPTSWLPCPGKTNAMAMGVERPCEDLAGKNTPPGLLSSGPTVVQIVAFGNDRSGCDSSRPRLS